MTKQFSEEDNRLSLWEEIKAFFIRKDTNVMDFHSVIEMSKDPIIMIDRDHTITGVSQALVNLFGFKKSELIGQHASILLNDPAEIIPFGNVVNHISVEKILKAKRKDGSLLTVDFTLAELTFGDETVFMGIVHDISDKLAADALERMKEISATREKVKNDYISILSHELRTPVAAVQGSLGMLLNQHKDAPGKHQELFSIAYRNTERLGKIINILLDLDSFLHEKPDAKFEEKSLIPIIKESVSISKFIAEMKNVTFVEKYPAIDIFVTIDSDRLLQVCLNLLSNAIKSSPEGEVVTVALDKVDDRVRVSFEDHGAGVPEDFKKELFMPFAQSEKGDTKKSGLGLGLHLSKKIVHLFDGEIGLVSNDGKGAIFYFELPLKGTK